MKAKAKIWLKLAQEDYENAELLWDNRRYGAAVFFSQQAVEKILLKPILLKTGRNCEPKHIE